MPQQKRAQVTRDALIVAAATVFAVRGYSRTTLDAVATAAGVTKGALYFHFESKQALADALISEEVRRAGERAQGILDRREPGLTSMMLLCRGIADQMQTDIVVAAGIKLTVEEGTMDLDVAYPYLEWISMIESLAVKARDEGVLADGLDPAVLAGFVIPAFTGVQHVSNTLTDRADLLQRIREMWTVLLPAIVRPELLPDVIDLPASLLGTDGD